MRCIAKERRREQCQHEAVPDGGDLLCRMHLLNLRSGRSFGLAPGTGAAEKAAIEALRQAEETPAADPKPADPEPPEADPAPWIWTTRSKMAMLTAFFGFLVLVVEARQRLAFDVPNGYGSLNLSTVPYALDNVLPTALMLLAAWLALVVVGLVLSAAVSFAVRVLHSGVNLPRWFFALLLGIQRRMAWGLAVSNPLHGMIPYDTGRRWVRQGARGAMVLRARYRLWRRKARRIMRRLEPAVAFTKLGRFGVMEGLWGWIDRLLARERLAGVLAIGLAAGFSLVGVIGITAVLTTELKERMASSQGCNDLDPIRSLVLMQVTCGHVVLDDKYPTLASGLDHSLGFERVAFRAGETVQQLRSEKVYYVMDVADWAILYRVGDAKNAIAVSRNKIVEFSSDDPMPPRRCGTVAYPVKIRGVADPCEADTPEPAPRSTDATLMAEQAKALTEIGKLQADLRSLAEDLSLLIELPDAIERQFDDERGRDAAHMAALLSKLEKFGQDLNALENGVSVTANWVERITRRDQWRPAPTTNTVVVAPLPLPVVAPEVKLELSVASPPAPCITDAVCPVGKTVAQAAHDPDFQAEKLRQARALFGTGFIGQCAAADPQPLHIAFAEGADRPSQRANAASAIASVAQDLAQRREGPTSTLVLVRGGASFTSSPARNRAVSVRRANWVKAALLREMQALTGTTDPVAAEHVLAKDGIHVFSYGMGERLISAAAGGPSSRAVELFVCPLPLQPADATRMAEAEPTVDDEGAERVVMD